MHEVPCLVMNPGERDCVGIRDIQIAAPDQSFGVWRTSPFFAGLVVIAGEFHPIPFRTRPLKPPAPMVLRVNTRASRSPPGLQRTDHPRHLIPSVAKDEGPPARRKERPVLNPAGLLW